MEAFWHGSWWLAKVISRKRKRDGSNQYKVLFDEGCEWDLVGVVRRCEGKKGKKPEEKGSNEDVKVALCKEKAVAGGSANPPVKKQRKRQQAASSFGIGNMVPSDLSFDKQLSLAISRSEREAQKAVRNATKLKLEESKRKFADGCELAEVKEFDVPPAVG